MKRLALFAITLLLFPLSLTAATTYVSGGPLPAGTGYIKTTNGVTSIQNVNTFSVYASGTAATINNVAGALDFGTTDPSLTITAPGTYMLFARVHAKFAAATFAANQTLNVYLYRTNNTPASVTGATTTITMPIVTTLNYSLPTLVIPLTLYTTVNATDVITIYGVLSANPGAGSVQATEAEVVAVRLLQ